MVRLRICVGGVYAYLPPSYTVRDLLGLYDQASLGRPGRSVRHLPVSLQRLWTSPLSHSTTSRDADCLPRLLEGIYGAITSLLAQHS
jgi:hypothetical protein